MANNNKKANRVVASPSSATNSERATMPWSPGSKNGKPEIEVDALTYDLDEQQTELNGRSRSELKAALTSRNTEVEQLRFDMEQLSGAKRSLEQELKARIEIAETFNNTAEEKDNLLSRSRQEIETLSRNEQRLKEKLSKSLADTTSRKHKLGSLEQEIARKEKRIAYLEKKLQKTSANSGASKQKRPDREQRDLLRQLNNSRLQVEELKTYVNGRRNEWTRLETALVNMTKKFDASQTRVQDLTSELDSRNAQLVRSREQYIATSDKFAQQKSQVRKLRKRNRELEHALNHEAKREISSCKTLISEQSGELRKRLHSLAELQEDRDRFANYADLLRMQLQDQISITKTSETTREKLEADLKTALDNLEEITAHYRKEQQRGDQLAKRCKLLEEESTQELQRVRFELGVAEETIAGHESINEQLTSDLIDNRSFRQALESQLGEVEQNTSKSVSKLREKLQTARDDADDLERELRNKDAVISDLMRELGNQGDAIELTDETSNVLQKIDGFKAAPGNTETMDHKNRTARQLIGSSDGKELRFPLFKDRLTIGRTAHNDIQLNMHFISRRHAVISTDHGRTRVIDWGSKNGVFVNDARITEKILESGDVVTIGATEFRYEEHAKR